ncbi:hypothetical protein ACFT2C_04700 [Promicromonospora sp. NPDC057138]|uniref:hypothetical protein n=1 Tax=Promicromonospora sp. NPDC057138 TaxID=3346031 RepID=UPI00363644F1
MSPEAKTVPLAVPAERALVFANKLSGIVHALAETLRRFQELQDAHIEAGTAIPGDWSPSAARNAIRGFTQAGEYLDDAAATLGDALRATKRLPELPYGPASAPASSSPQVFMPGARGTDGPDGRRSASPRDPQPDPGPPRRQDGAGPEFAL